MNDFICGNVNCFQDVPVVVLTIISDVIEFTDEEALKWNQE